MLSAMRFGLFLITLFLVGSHSVFPVGFKIVKLPKEIKVEENDIKISTIRNMSEVEIYKTYQMKMINGFIYLVNFESSEIVKISLNGRVISRMGKKGQGPSEFIGLSYIAGFGENIAALDAYKVVICDQNLRVLKDIRLENRYGGLIFSRDNRVYLFDNPSIDNYYFSVYTNDFRFIKQFARKTTTTAERQKSKTWDLIRQTLYVQEENGIWVSFRNRYDLRYYTNEKLTVEIKAEKNFFSKEETEHMGRKFIRIKDSSVLLAKNKSELYYLFRKGRTLFCDVFNLTQNYRLIRRIKLPKRYKTMVHHQSHFFFGLRYDDDGENVLLDKVYIK